MSVRRILLAALGTAAGGIALAGDWPHFRGPDGTGAVTSGKLPTEWDGDKNIAWTASVPGVAWSCPIVVGDNVFVTSAFAEGQNKPRAGGGFGGGGGRQGGPGGGQPPGGTRPPLEGEQPPGGGGQRGGQGRGGNAAPDKVFTWKVVCLDKATGKQKWEQVVAEGKPKFNTHNSNTFASETPTSDGERVYVYFGATGAVAAYDLAGKPVWKKDIGAYPNQMNWGSASSPTVHNGLLYIQCDNEQKSFLLALDAKTGEEKWKVDRTEKSNWSTPYVWKQKDRTDLVVGGTGKVRGYDPADGKVIWELAIGGGQSNATPVGTADLLYFGTGGMGGGGGGRGGQPGGGGRPGGGQPPAGAQPPGGAGGQPPGGGRGGMGGGANAGTLFAIKAGATGDITPKAGEKTSAGVLWGVPRIAPAAATPIIYDGYVYCLARQGGMISCVDAKTGKLAYENERIPNAKSFWASGWAYDGKVFCLDEEGVTHVLKAGPAFELIRTNKLAKDVYWSSPALVDGLVVMRGVDKIMAIK